jgi:4-amino-4-deoxy-L-arabinose transferase-like glycosyltransferase
MDILKRNSLRLVGLMLATLFIVSTVVSYRESATYDERAHIPAAFTYLNAHDMRVNPEHPPLIKDLAGAPLQFLGLSFPYGSDAWQTGRNEQWTLGDLFINCTDPNQSCNDADAILLWSRLPITLLAVVFGIGIFLWTRELGGTLAGLLATLLYAADPNVIAHSHYVTTDLGIAGTIFAAAYFFVRFLRYPSYRTMFTAGFFLGIAELTKFSAVLLFPIFGLFVLAFAVTKQQPKTDTRTTFSFRFHTLFSYVFKFIGSVTISFVLIWTVYALNMFAMPADKVHDLADLFLSQPNAPSQMAHAAIVTLGESPILRPFAVYFVGVAKVFARVGAGNIYYYLGNVSDKASASYFPLVFILKETLPFLFLLLATTFYSLYRIGKHYVEERRHPISLWKFFARSLQARPAQHLAVFFVLFYAFISITGNLNIGFRHLFPILPFLYMLVGKTAIDFFKRQCDNPVNRKLSGLILGGIAFAIAAIPVIAFPHYLSYFNAAAGGHLNGYKYVTDSNYDWGQDLKYLRDFVDQYNSCQTSKSSAQCSRSLLHFSPETVAALPKGPIDKIRVDYFGGSSPAYYLGDTFISWWGEREPEPGWYAISSFFYQESIYKQKPAGARDYSWLKGYTPVTRVGDSFFIYYIPPVAD